MPKFSKRFWDVMWWIGIPVIVGVLVWGPYISLNVIHRVSWPLWRMPFVPIYVFDSSAYYQWIGAALSGITYGDYIRSFDWIIRTLGHVLPHTWSVAEVWLLTLWASVIAAVWLMSACIARWSDCSVGQARWFSVIALSSFVLPFMPRPGVYTWYAGFYAFGLIGVWYVQRALHRSSYLSAFAWTAVSLAATWVYPYFLIHIFLWLAALWFIRLHRRSPRVMRTLGGIAIISVPPVLSLLIPMISRPEYQLAYALQERAGLAWTRLPVISNSLLLACLWTGFLLLCAYVVFRQSPERERLVGLIIGWIALLAGWFSNVFTGVYIHNDHFRNPVLLFSWVSLFVVFGVIQKAIANDGGVSMLEQKGHPRIMVHFVRACFVISGGMLLAYLFVKGYVFHGDLLNVVHASHWLALAAASYFVWRFVRFGRIASAMTVFALSFFAIVPGIVGRGYVFAQEMRIFPSYEKYAPVIEWVREHVPARDGVCADPELATILGSFSAHLVYPTYVTAMLPKPDREILDDLKIELEHFSPSGDLEEEAYFRTFDSMRGTTCSQFNGLKKLSVFIGVSSETFDVLSNCPRGVLRQHQAILRSGTSTSSSRREDFERLCPVIITTVDTYPRWRVPDGYSKVSIDGIFSSWRKID